ncbi:hypothetical protein [Paenibacillus eucommiae]|uniref:TM2 domain-containing membrane protein YozV n=1 Tax=Paenibacillus eucommiae TaxID=1355755 RepID=A0ABS4IV13_9BACL|nr:hypothetical protein [Paenibacillus eucommiae]MBP1990925.1 TM2 domain-containing membrane protein YozV [Paenibacillus eucommiae]
MSQSNEAQYRPEFTRHEDLIGEPFGSMHSDPYQRLQHQPYSRIPRKRKWIAGLFSIFVPGTGQFYLGLMERGLWIMLPIILDIFIIVNFGTADEVSVPLMTLFILFLPIIYFYSIFDALQSTDYINRRYELGDLMPGSPDGFKDPLQKLVRGNNLGTILIAVGVIIFMVSTKPKWFVSIFDLMGSYVGSILLIAAGAVIFFLEARKK